MVRSLRAKLNQHHQEAKVFSGVDLFAPQDPSKKERARRELLKKLSPETMEQLKSLSYVR